MTIRELITSLEKMPLDDEIFIRTLDSDGEAFFLDPEGVTVDPEGIMIQAPKEVDLEP